MKFAIKVAILFFFLTLLGSLIFSNYSVYNTNKVLTEHVEETLVGFAESRALLVNSFLNRQKEKILIISHSEIIKDFLQNFSKRDELYDSIFSDMEYFKEEFLFDEMFLLEPNGEILINTQEGFTPLNIFKSFNFSLEEQGIAYAKELRYCYCIKRYVVDVTTPIYQGENLLGVVVARLLLENLEEITNNTKGLGELGEIYIVNTDGLLITPSKFLKAENRGIFTQKMINKNTLNCFAIKELDTHIGYKAIVSFRNFLGEEVIGTHEFLSEPNWCLLVEVNKKEVLGKPISGVIKSNIYLSLSLIVLFTFFGFLIGKRFDKKYTFTKKKIPPCGIKKKQQPLYCIFLGGRCKDYPKGMCGRVIKMRNFFSRLNPSSAVFFISLVAIVYTILIYFLFKGISSQGFLGYLPDLLCLIATAFLFGVYFKHKDGFSGRFILIGSLLLIFSKIIEIFLQGYGVDFQGMSYLFWISQAVFAPLGYLVLLFAVRGEVTR